VRRRTGEAGREIPISAPVQDQIEERRRRMLLLGALSVATSLLGLLATAIRAGSACGVLVEHPGALGGPWRVGGICRPFPVRRDLDWAGPITSRRCHLGFAAAIGGLARRRPGDHLSALIGTSR
jgi:hypothetical protein